MSWNLRRISPWLLGGILAFFLYKIIRPFLVPLVWAAALAIFFYPLYCRVGRFISRPNLAAALTLAVIAVMLVLPMVLVTQALAAEAASMIDWLGSGDLIGKLNTFTHRYLSSLPIGIERLQEILTDLTRAAGGFLAQQSAHFASGVAWFVFDLAFMLLALFYLLRDGRALLNLVSEISPLAADGHARITARVAELVQVTILSSFVVAAVQGVLGGVTFWLLNIPSPVLWGVLMGMLAFLPVAGPWLAWGPVAAWLILSGETTRGVVLLIAGFLLVSGADNILRPLLIAGRSQLNGLLVFISILGGIQAFGFVGVVVGPVVVATAAGLLRSYRQKLEA